VITVVGGTGRLGRVVVASLTARDTPVRVVSRHAGSAATASDRHLAAAELVEADVADPRQARAAIAGSSQVVAAMTGMNPRGGAGPQAVDRDAAIVLIDAAADAGCHLVLVSVVGAAPDSPIELLRMKAAAEAHLRARAVPWTIVRATAFAELWNDVITDSAGRDGRARLLGPAQNPMNFVKVDDVASAVVRALDDSALVGQCIEVRGSDNLSLTDYAARLTGRPPKHLPTALVRTLAIGAQPFAPGLARIARQALAMEQVDLVHEAVSAPRPSGQ
jgi:NADH dehydrogenase